MGDEAPVFLGGVGLTAIVFTFVTILCCKASKQDGIAEMQAEAIKANVAEWQVNPTTGEIKFVWKP